MDEKDKEELRAFAFEQIKLDILKRCYTLIQIDRKVLFSILRTFDSTINIETAFVGMAMEFLRKYVNNLDSDQTLELHKLLQNTGSNNNFK